MYHLRLALRQSVLAAALSPFAGCQSTDAVVASSPAPQLAQSVAKAAGASKNSLPGSSGLTAIKAETILPSVFPTALAADGTPKVLVPPNMLLVSEVTRKEAEVRSGPGPQFELLDTVLPKGARVLVFKRVGKWQKILVAGSGKSGWVHEQSISEPTPNTNAFTIDVKRLPTVLAVHDVATVEAFNYPATLIARVPRGAQFRMLRLADKGTLVWLPQTNSVMWLAREDVQ